MQEHEQKEEEFDIRKIFVPFTSTKAIHWIIVIGLIVYFNSFFNGFVGDDLGQIVNNTFIHSILNIPIFFQGSTFFNGTSQALIGNYYRPLFVTFFAGIYTLFGPNPFAFHLAQVLLHITNTILFFLFLRHFFKRSIAFILSLIFLVHPINSEIVLYISDTQELLFFFFGMIALLLFSFSKTIKSFIIATICLLFSLLSKETGILFVGIVIVYAFLFKKKYLLNSFVGGGIIFIVYLILRIHALGIFTQPTNSSIASYSFIDRMINVPAMFLFYLKTFIFPFDLASSYQWVYTNIDFFHFFLPLIIDFLFIIGIVLLGYFIYKKSQQKYFTDYIFFVCWFFAGMLIHMQILPLDATVAEGWFYFPIVGLLGMIGITLEIFKINVTNKIFIPAIVCIMVLLSIRTFIRSFDWRNEFTIASHDIKVSKDAWGLENELSYAYFQKGMYPDAKIYAERSIQLYPFAINYINLGAADFSMKDYRDAKNAYIQSLHYGNFNQTYDSLAFLALSYGDPQKNIKFIKNSALPRFPQDGKLWLYLAALEYNFGNKQNARFEIQQAYKYDPEMQTIGVYNAIMNNKPVRINLKS